MLKLISEYQREKIENTIAGMSLEDKAAQVLCWNIGNESAKGIKQIIAKHPVGAVFIGPSTPKRIAQINQALKASKVPIIVTGDLEHGAGSVIKGDLEFPLPLAASAANSTKLIYEMGLATGRQGRQRGFHWTLAPVADLAMNHNNPVTGSRALGDTPRQVSKMVKPFLCGLQDGNLAACCKHFPGDGLDDRDQHFCTSVNSQTEKQWFNSYGKVWRDVIQAGTMSIMVGHLALPFKDAARDYRGAPPATLSRIIQIDLLRGVLGFDGLIISDAVSMVGINAHAEPDKLAVKNIASGSDMVLFGQPGVDDKYILKAVQCGSLSKTRLDDAVRRILELKARVGLLDELQKCCQKISVEEIEHYQYIAQQIADRSITLVRDATNCLPLSLKAGDKVLTVTIGYMGKGNRKRDLTVIDDELRQRGLKVTHWINPSHYQLLGESAEYQAIFINMAVLPHSLVGTMRLTGAAIMPFWRAFWVAKDNVIFTSFGNPQHLYELASIPNYINAYSNTVSSQMAAVKFWLGEITSKGKSPIKIKT